MSDGRNEINVDNDDIPLAELSRRLQEEAEENIPLSELAEQLKAQKQHESQPQTQKRIRPDSDSEDDTRGSKYSKEIYEKRLREESSSDEDSPPDKIPCKDLPDLPTDESDIDVIRSVAKRDKNDAQIKLFQFSLSSYNDLVAQHLAAFKTICM